MSNLTRYVCDLITLQGLVVFSWKNCHDCERNCENVLFYSAQ